MFKMHDFWWLYNLDVEGPSINPSFPLIRCTLTVTTEFTLASTQGTSKRKIKPCEGVRGKRGETLRERGESERVQ